MNHSSESNHIWTIGTLEGWLSFHDSWPQVPCPRVGQEVKIWDIFKKCFSSFLLWKQLMQIVVQTWMAQSCDIDLWVMKWRSAWPIFHSPVILAYILKTISCMYIVLWDYESVWPEVWPQINVGHCDLYFTVQWFCLVSWRLWCMNVIIWYYESVWPNVWPQNNCRSLWPILQGPVILCYILKTIWCMNIILWDYESVLPDVWNLKIIVDHCDLYFMVQRFCIIPWSRVTEILKSKLVRSTNDVIMDVIRTCVRQSQIATKTNDSSFSSKSVSEIDYFSNTYCRRVVSLSKTLFNYPGSGGSVPTWLKNCWLGR